MTATMRPPALPGWWRAALGGGVDAHRDRHCVWVVSPEGYPHARAFDHVAVGLAEGLAAVTGSAPVVHDPADIGDRHPVVVGANLLDAEAVATLAPEAIVVNLEQVDATSSWFSDGYLELLSAHAVVDYSIANTAALHRLGLDHVRHLRLGWSPGQVTVPHQRTDIVDVCFYGSINARRAALLDELERRGLIVERLFGVYGADRDAAIARAKVVLNVHYYPSAVFESVRVTHLLANRVCVVSEGAADDPDVSPYLGAIALGRYDELADRCEELVADRRTREDLAAAGAAAIAAVPQADGWRRLFDEAEMEPLGPAPAGVATVRRVTERAPTIRSATLLAPSFDPERLRSVRLAAIELAGLGVEVTAAAIDAPDRIERTGWHCLVRGGQPLDGVEPVGSFVRRDDHLVVLPDVLARGALIASPFRLALWWFSVDDLVAAGGSLSAPGLIDAVAADASIDHLHHGAYVREFLRSRGVTSRRLDDHLDLPARHLPTTPPTDGSPTVSVDAPDGLAPMIVNSLQGLSTIQLTDATMQDDEPVTSSVHVHAGRLWGRDRRLRLAAASGAVVFVANRGAGRYVDDVEIGDHYRFDDDALASGDLARRVRMALAVPGPHLDAQASYRSAIAGESQAMRRQLAQLTGRCAD